MSASKSAKARVVPPGEFLAARTELLKKEKQFTKLRDEISRLRRELPWERIEKNYVFEGPQGKVPLGELFADRSQLIVYHFMLGPGWSEGCPSCSYLADHFDGMLPHLAARDIRFVAISRAPLPEIQAFQKRMGWKFPWYSSNGSDFNCDHQVSIAPDEVGQDEVYYNYSKQKFGSEERPGASVFYKDKNGEVYHTYSTYGRGLDILIGTYNWIDLTPMGRNEEVLKFPMAWIRHHDKYGSDYRVDANVGYIQPAKKY
jgi:predicted dithiol-disulfide oxidoreductase (DUF899 family)